MMALQRTGTKPHSWPFSLVPFRPSTMLLSSRLSLSALPTFFAHTALASSYYSNSTNTVISSVYESSTHHSNAIGDYILQGLGSQRSTSTAPSSPAASKSAQPNFNASYSTAPSRTFEPMSSDVFSALLSSTDLPQSVRDAQQCWSQIMTWTTSYYSWYSATVANRAWPVTYTTTTQVASSNDTVTIYPTNASAYTLCDGSARVDVDPITTTTPWLTTYGTYTHTGLALPSFAPQPCDPSQLDCYVWYHNSSAYELNEDAFLNQCGLPVHGRQPCAFALMDAVELIYFPVQTVDGNLCAGNGSTIEATPTVSGQPNTVSTLGRVFTSGKVYFSMSSLWATQDGFPGVTLGTPRSNFILTLESSEISTQCGGNRINTQINYADMNWPVPASAWNCQSRCAKYSNYNAFSNQTSSIPDFCNTIYKHLNPLVGLPTQLTDLDPEWKTCTLNPENMAGFWYDPPIALTAQKSAAQPTLPSAKTTTPAAAASTPTRPIAASTKHDPVSSAMALASSSTKQGPSKPTSSAVDSQDQGSPPVTDPSHSTYSVTKIISTTLSFHFDPSSVLDASSEEIQSPSQIGSKVLSLDVSTMESQVADAPAFSILTEALSTFGTLAGASPSDVGLSSGNSHSTPRKPPSSTDSMPSEHTIISESPSQGAVGSSTTDAASPQAVLQADGMVITPSALASDIISFAGHAVTLGGSAISMESVTVTYGSDGLALITSGSTIAFTTAEATTNPRQTFVADMDTTTFSLVASAVAGSNSVLHIGTQLVSQGGDPAVINDITYSLGHTGLEILQNSTNVIMQTVDTASTHSTARLPSVVVEPSQTSEIIMERPTTTAASTSESRNSNASSRMQRGLLWLVSALSILLTGTGYI
ncbi:hypothetical protein AC578_7185 [Pseudocercospora eumusae]|uniref:Uncharacterized protein n=1 Tax=Pseudocercospora eumusae TaxID=321146 RepID=A0A139HWK0_9PEZI|nr:hypothetical protein AC578_7185 [Pseudocercospora eumusae]